MQTLDAVHSGHHMIHENDIITLFKGLFQALLPTHHGIDLHPRRAQQLFCNHQIRLIVIHDKHMRIRCLKALLVVLVLIECMTHLEIELSELLFICRFLRQRNHKGRSLCIHTVYRDLTAHQIYELFDDRQSKSRALDVAVALLIHTAECLKQMRNLLPLDTHSGIRHRIYDLYHTVFLPLACDGKRHRAFRRIFDRVV